MKFPELIHRQFDVRQGEYIDIDFLGDWHGGHPLYLQEELEAAIKEVETVNNRYAILMGDPMEVGTKSSVADGVYEQTMDPDEQEDYTGDLLAPCGDEEKILGGVGGNHGNRTRKSDGIRVDRTIAKYANYPFNPMCLYYLIEINDITHTIFTTHGQTSSSREAYQNLVIRRWENSHGGADFYCMGHL